MSDADRPEPSDGTDPRMPMPVSWHDWLVMQVGDPKIGRLARFLLDPQRGGPARLNFTSKTEQQELADLFEKFNRDTEGQPIETPVEWRPVADLSRHDVPWRIEAQTDGRIALDVGVPGQTYVVTYLLSVDQVLRMVKDLLAAAAPSDD